VVLVLACLKDTHEVAGIELAIQICVADPSAFEGLDPELEVGCLHGSVVIQVEQGAWRLRPDLNRQFIEIAENGGRIASRLAILQIAVNKLAGPLACSLNVGYDERLLVWGRPGRTFDLFNWTCLSSTSMLIGIHEVS
jgi:hypothetical protein